MESSRKGIGGPRTPEGKLKVSLNALKHGLTAVSPQAREALLEKYQDDYEKTLMRMRRHYMPRDFLEEELVKRIARCLARLDRSADMERRLVQRTGDPCSPGASLRTLVTYERTVDIHLHRAVRALERKRDAECGKNTKTNSLPDF